MRPTAFTPLKEILCQKPIDEDKIDKMLRGHYYKKFQIEKFL